MLKLLLLLVVFIKVRNPSYSQTSSRLAFLKHELNNRRPASYDTTIKDFQLLTDSGLHYLNPVYAWVFYQDNLKHSMGLGRFYDNASQWIAFNGDYKMSNAIAETSIDTLSARSRNQIDSVVSSYKGSTSIDARAYILKKAADYRVIMINEAHHNPSHRAFTFSLLEDLYKQGFRYLAMETFNNHSPHVLDKLNASTGTYICEPIGGELVRRALKLGYRLVSYEDTVYQPGRTSTQRDSAQANHINEVLEKDKSAKILVHAGYGHIGKMAIEDYVPLGLALHSLSGLPYLSIDQTTYSEGSHYAYERTMYDAYIKRYPLKAPAIAFKKNTNINLFDTADYDLNIIHPKTVFADGRPAWASLNGLRKKQVVGKSTFPANTFFVQAYYQRELKNDPIQNLVPADQTYNKTSNGDFVLYLQKDNYTLVLRDALYQIIQKKDIQIQ